MQKVQNKNQKSFAKHEVRDIDDSWTNVVGKAKTNQNQPRKSQRPEREMSAPKVIKSQTLCLHY